MIKMATPSNYILRLRLTQFLGSRVIDVENDDGFTEKGVFIPLEINGFNVTAKGNVNAYAFVTERMTASVDGTTHYLKLKTKADALKRMNELGYTTPYIGEMKPSRIMPNFQKACLENNVFVKAKNYSNTKNEE